MRIDLDTDKYNVVIDSSNFDVSISDGGKLDVNIGESARIDVNSAVTYIKSGEKEIDSYVDGKIKPEILEYSKVESQKFIDAYVGSTVEEYVNEVTKPSIDEFTNTKISDFDTNAASKTDDFNTLSSSKIDEFNTLSNTLTGEYNTLAQTSEETLIQYVDSASLSAKNAKDSADVSTAQASISTAQAVISTAKASESLASANASQNYARQCQDIKDSFDETVDLSSYAKKTDLNSKQDKLTAGTGIKIENNVVSNTQTSAEWGNIKGTLSNQTDLQNALNNKVSKSGDETITGIKSFNNKINLKGGIDLINSNVTKGTTPTSTQYWGLFRCNDASNSTTWQNTRLGVAELSLDTSNTVKLSLGVYKNEAGSGSSSVLSIFSDANGYRYATLSSSPATGDNSTKIATTQWVKNTIKTDSSAGRNVGDIFYTSRTDTELNGAVECNGGTYSTSDFTGSQSIGNLLSQKKVPYVSLSEYSSIVSSKGCCRAFGWDGGTSFRVPTVPAKLLTKEEAVVVGNGMTLGINDGANDVGLYSQSGDYARFVGGTSLLGTNVGTSTSGAGNMQRDKSLGITTDPTKSGIVTNLDVIEYRAMVQLAIKSTDDAVITATSALQQISNKVDKTSATDRATVVGWGMPDYNSAVSVEVNFTGSSYTVQNTGYYIINLSKNTANSGAGVFINNIRIMYISITSAWEETTAVVLLKQGDIVSCSGSVYLAKITTFIPFLGVK